MRHLIRFMVLFTLLSAQALASETQLVELVVFRQSSDSLPASRVAPDSWANGATPISAEMQRSTRLGHLTEKLTADNGYQILLHSAWLQNSTDDSVRIAVSEGMQHFNHYPVEGTLDFTLDRTSSVLLDLWINQFNADKTLLSSEHFKQKALVPSNQVTFVDHGTLGALIRIQPQNLNNQDNQDNADNPEAQPESHGVDPADFE